MLFPILTTIGALGAGGWVYHKVFGAPKLAKRLDALEQKKPSK